MPFTVYDQGGNEVAVGQVGGDPVELEQGAYRVVVDTATLRTFDDLNLSGESELVLELNSPRDRPRSSQQPNQER